ncbi:hypothetical protein KIPB_015424 [Kipferlia bialata]|uniref:Uncharacterized protein n=1 Tax=Kipferlia bialata TaxID=797122 RepID=A0A391NUA4_9EUKA|nr:hypothetical protein KIPB_015424 [Kipferlia bialata]|eukprot:g15424.t1
MYQTLTPRQGYEAMKWLVEQFRGIDLAKLGEMFPDSSSQLSAILLFLVFLLPASLLPTMHSHHDVTEDMTEEGAVGLPLLGEAMGMRANGVETLGVASAPPSLSAYAAPKARVQVQEADMAMKGSALMPPVSGGLAYGGGSPSMSPCLSPCMSPTPCPPRAMGLSQSPSVYDTAPCDTLPSGYTAPSAPSPPPMWQSEQALATMFGPVADASQMCNVLGEYQTDMGMGQGIGQIADIYHFPGDALD